MKLFIKILLTLFTLLFFGEISFAALPYEEIVKHINEDPKKCQITGEIVGSKKIDDDEFVNRYAVVIKNNTGYFIVGQYLKKPNTDLVGGSLAFLLNGGNKLNEMIGKNAKVLVIGGKKFRGGKNIDDDELFHSAMINNDKIDEITKKECKPNYSAEDFRQNYSKENRKQQREPNLPSFVKGYEDIFFYGFFVLLFLNIVFITLLLRKKK